jgi:superfamily II DNA/RNA helicase
MPSATPILKRHNHRVHPCKEEKKAELLELLLQKNSDKKIIVVTSNKTELTSDKQNVTIVSDEELASNPEMRYDMLISYDLPAKAITYMARISKTDTYATILLDPSEEKLIHPIEILIGRTIMQELIEGFSEVPIVKQAQPIKKDSKPEEKKREFKPKDEKREFKPRDDKKAYRSDKKYDDKSKKPYSKDSKDGKKPWDDKPKKSYSDDSKGERKPWDKKKKTENKFLGKDENGKAIFSGKSGERNHRYDGTPREKPQATKLTGKKINIKSLKKKEDQ